MANKVIWKQNYTWRRLAFITFGDSREFRRLLEANPNYDIGRHPPEGEIVFLPDNVSTENGISEQLNLSDFAGREDSVEETENYPWSNFSSLYSRLGDYTNEGLRNYRELNGNYL